MTRSNRSTLALGHVPPWQQATLLSSLVVSVGLAILTVHLAVPPPFLVSVALVLGLQVGIFAAADRHLVTDGRSRLTPATVLTICRGSAAVVLAGFLVVEQPTGPLAWLPALLFGAAALFDGVDGAIARTTNTESAFGSRLDTETDSLALLIGVLVAIRYGQAPLLFLLVGIARYVFLGGIVVRRWRHSPVRELPPRSTRRVLGAGMMIVVFILLTPLFERTAANALALVAMVPFLLGFARDWWLVTRGDAA